MGRRPGATHARWLVRVAMVIAAMAGLVVAGAGPASAHTELERTTPAAESVVKASPSQIHLYFDEAVLADDGSIRLYDDHLQPVPIDETFRPAGHDDEIAAAVPDELRDGTYTVTWRVTSADTHIVSGGFAFSVGKRTTVSGRPPDTSVDDTTSNVSGVVRGLGYAGLAAGPGALVVLMWLWPAGLARRRVRAVLLGGGGLLALATVAGFVVQGALASGKPLGSALTWSSVRLGLQGHFGRAGIERLVLLALLVLAVAIGRQLQSAVRRAQLVGVVALLMFATWPFAGHAVVGPLVPLAFVADWVHVAAMATWLGGLLVLLLAVLRERESEKTAAVVAAYSEWALAAMTLIVATGLFAAWRNVRSWGALPATTYGQVLLWKSGVVVGLVAVAYLSRRWVRRVAAAGGAGVMTGLRRSVVAEAGVAAVVLGLTAALTGSAQAYDVYAPSFTRTATDADITVRVHVDSPRVGRATLVVSTTRLAGEPQRIRRIEGSLSKLSPPIGPLPVQFRDAGVGKAVATVTFPDRGDWSLQLSVQTSAITAIALTTTIPVR